MRILLVGGGTGGHVFPLVAVAEALQAKIKSGAKADLYFMGAGDLICEEAKGLGIPCYKIIAPKWRRYFSFQNFLDILKIPVALAQSLVTVWLLMPDIVFAKGGFASFFPLLAAKILFIPVVLHESDSVPGFVNKIFGKLALRVFISFQSSAKWFNVKKTQLVGLPIRAEILSLTAKEVAVSALGLNNDRPVVLIVGGSQGAQSLNNALMLSLSKLIQKYIVIHQTGQGNYDEVAKQLVTIIKEEPYLEKDIQTNYKIVPRLQAREMGVAYSATDVAIIRSGSQIFEVAARGIPAILVPLPLSANNHQLINAQEASKFGAVIITQDNLTANILLNEIDKVYANRRELSDRIRQFAKPDAALVIASYLLGQ